MVIFLYTNDKCEYQAKHCVESLLPRLSSDDKVVYFTNGFDSNLTYKNFYKIKIPIKEYPTFHYYKAELSLLIMDLFPNEEHFCFTDTDVFFSRRANLKKLEHNFSYPLASFGPHECPFTYESINDRPVTQTEIDNNHRYIIVDNHIGIATAENDSIIFNENVASHYFNVKRRSMRYVWSCFYVFNRGCRDFFEEYTSMCQNKYLLNRRKSFYPFHDETPFNICLWKRNATQSLGFAFVNTHSLEVVIQTETEIIKDKHIGKHFDEVGADWEYIEDSSKVILYHGFKDFEVGKQTLQFLLNE